MAKYLDATGVSTLWGKIKGTFLTTSTADSRYLRHYSDSSLDANSAAQGWHDVTNNISNAAHSNHSALIYVSNVGTPFQLQIPDSSVMYIYKRYYSGGWSSWEKMKAGDSDTLEGHASSYFATSGHTHDSSYLKYSGSWDGGETHDSTTATGMVFAYSNHGVPGVWGTLTTFAPNSGSSYNLQLYGDGWNNEFYLRTRSADNGQHEWRKVIHSGNYTSYCAPASHTHPYLPLSGGTLSGNLTVSGSITCGVRADFGNNSSCDLWFNRPSANYFNAVSDGWFVFRPNGASSNVLSIDSTGVSIGGTLSITSSSLVSNLNADLLDGYHEYSFLRFRGSTSTTNENTLWDQIGIKQYTNALPDTLATYFPDAYTYGEVISLCTSDARFDIYANHGSTDWDSIYVRSGWDSDKRRWKRLAFTDSNVTSATYASTAGSVAWNNISDKPSTFTPSSHTHDYLPLSGGTITGTLRVTHRLNIGYDVGDWDGYRAELELITASDNANDFWMGANSARKWGLSTRSSHEGYALQLYNSDLTPTVRVQQNGNVGIGTDSPGYKLDVSGTTRILGNLLVGANASNNFIAFYGNTGDGPGSYATTFIGEHLWGSPESTELLLMKFNDVGNGDDGTTVYSSGPDRIRHIAHSHVFQVMTDTTQGSFETMASTSAVETKFDISRNRITSYVPLFTQPERFDTLLGSNSGIGAIHLNNSDITGVNAITTSDLSESWAESLAFKRSNGNWDTFRAADGTFYFGVNNGTEYTAVHSGNIGSQSVSYATSSGTANSPRGFSFSDRSSDDWTGVPGTFIADWAHSSGADIMFKYDGSKLNVITDGRFYQGIDVYGSSKRVLDEYDITHTTWGNADTVDGYHYNNLPYAPWKEQWIDMTGYSESYWHPVVTSLPYGGYRRIKVTVQLNSGTAPSWSTHPSGFTCNLDLWTTAYGWGTTSSETICLNSTYSYADQNPVGWFQLGNASHGILLLRGGGKYLVCTDWDSSWTIYNQSVTDYGGTQYEQTCGPYTSWPGIFNGNTSKNTIYAHIDGNCYGNATTASSVPSLSNSEIDSIIV